jgi:6-phosphogluconolactonase
MSTSLSVGTILLVVGLSVVLSGCQSSDEPLRMYVGGYTNPKSGGKGIYLFEFDPKTGAIKETGLAAEAQNPSFVALNEDHSRLYAIGEMPEFAGKKAGAVSAFAVDPATGKLTLLNQQPSGGGGPCHVSITADGKTVLVANYGGGSVASFPVQSDGKLGEAASVVQHTGKGTDPGRQEAPHAHGIWPAPGDKFVVSCDLGLDKVLVYSRDPKTGALTMLEGNAGEVPPGGGARHAAFSPDGKHLYAINEMGNTITAFDWDAKAGKLTPIQSVGTLPEGYKDKSYTSEVIAHPSGKFLYGSNRGHDSIAVFSIDPKTGKLTFVEATPIGGKWPRHFNLDPTGRWLIAAGEHSNTLTAFKVDPSTGKLTQVGESVPCPQPSCVVFAPKH